MSSWPPTERCDIRDPCASGGDAAHRAPGPRRLGRSRFTRWETKPISIVGSARPPYGASTHRSLCEEYELGRDRLRLPRACPRQLFSRWPIIPRNIPHFKRMRLPRFVRCAPLLVATILSACSSDSSTGNDHGIPDLDGLAYFTVDSARPHFRASTTGATPPTANGSNGTTLGASNSGTSITPSLAVRVATTASGSA